MQMEMSSVPSRRRGESHKTVPIFKILIFVRVERVGESGQLNTLEFGIFFWILNQMITPIIFS